MPLLNNLQPPDESVTEEEITLITLQLFVTLAFIITTAASLLLAYDLLLKKKGMKPLFTNEEALKINNMIKYTVFALVIIIFFINLRSVEITTEKGTDTTNDKTQLLISSITLVAAGIGVWLAMENTKKFNLISIENAEV